MGFVRHLPSVVGLAGALLIGPADAQTMLDGLNLTSPAMAETEVTQDEREAELEAAEAPLGLTGKYLNGIDLSGVTLRSARLNGANLRDADLSAAVLDQAWMLNVNLADADLTGANLFQAQLIGSNLDGAESANLDRAQNPKSVFRG